MDKYTSDPVFNDILEFVKENDVRFIKLVFSDLFGSIKSISITPDKLPLAFSEGVSFDASSIKGFTDITSSDLLLFPDLSTLSVLPWRPQEGRVARFYCTIKYPDGTPFECDTRNILKNTQDKMTALGYSCKIGAECEFYLFKTDDDGEPTSIPFDKGGYCDAAPLDKGENVRREICFTLEDMGLSLESSHHEQGPGQNEIDFKFSELLESADNVNTFKTAVKAIAARNGLFASFMPKPLADCSGNGMHINISLFKNGKNIFLQDFDDNLKISESFIAGILEKSAEITAFLNPIPNSYERLGKFEAPQYISWSRQNRSQLIRIPAAKNERIRMELRSPDPSANPYLAFALIVNAGIYGIENNLKLPSPVDYDIFSADTNVISSLSKLPENLHQAIVYARESKFIPSVIGKEVCEKYLSFKDSEYLAYKAAQDKHKFSVDNYFLIV